MIARFDVAIVGGGPAGSVAARRLARFGLRVALLERGGGDRDKVCGCCLAPRALPLLENEGLLGIARSCAAGETRGIAIHGARGAQMQANLGRSDGRGGLLLPRNRFDQALRDAAASAGAIVYQQASARVASLSNDGAALEVRQGSHRFGIRCRLLIGADGLGSTVARAAGLSTRSSRGRKVGMSWTVADSNGRELIASGVIEMFLLDRGYLGAVRMNDGRIHCAAIIDRTSIEPPLSPREAMKRASLAHPTIAGMHLLRAFDSRQVRAKTCGPMPWRPVDVATGSVALIGDAAGYVEPFTGEGMTWALESAIVLAKVIEDAGGAWNPHTARWYRQRWRAAIETRHVPCRMIARALELPSLHSAMLRAANFAPGVARWIIARTVAA